IGGPLANIPRAAKKKGESFEPNILVGKFTPTVAILYKKISVTTNVWIANRNTTLTGSSGVLKVRSPGILGLVDHKNTTVWSSNTSKFDNPGDTLIPGMKLVRNNITSFNLNGILHPGNPSQGNYTD
ncbi:S-locus lectin protein kinase family protein, partial [Prunus dulcis]